MRVAITGATGVVGSAVLRHLVDEGHDVAALVRSDRAAMSVSRIGAQPVVGDLADADSLSALVSGAKWVFNVAGVNELCVSDREEMWRANVEGPQAVLGACQRAGVAT